METVSYIQLLYAFSLTLFAGLATAFGALFSLTKRSDDSRILALGLGFSAGVMIYISFVEILVKSQNAFAKIYGVLEGEILGLVAFFGGIVFTFIIDQLIPDNVNPHHALEYNRKHHGHDAALNRIGIFAAIAITLHNFPEGFATFVMAVEDFSSGVAVAFAIAIHNIPEGLAVALPVYHATKSREKAFLYASATGLSEPIGAILGYTILAPLMGKLTLGIAFGVVAGIMVYIAFDELLPAARRYGSEHHAIVGMTLGMFVIATSLILFKL